MRLLLAILTLLPGLAKAGDLVVELFVAPDCPIVNSYAPEIERIYREYRDKGVDFLLVYPDRDLDEAKVRAHREEYALTLPFAIDGDRTRVAKAGATTTPEAVVFDGKGGIRYQGRIDDRYSDLGDRRATVSAAYLREAIEALLAGKAPPLAKTTAIGCLIEP